MTVQEAIDGARELRAQGIGGPCPHCGRDQTNKPDGSYAASGSHDAATEAAFTGYVLCCYFCEQPLGRVQGFLHCPRHGWECDKPRRLLGKDERKRYSIDEEKASV